MWWLVELREREVEGIFNSSSKINIVSVKQTLDTVLLIQSRKSSSYHEDQCTKSHDNHEESRTSTMCTAQWVSRWPLAGTSAQWATTGHHVPSCLVPVQVQTQTTGCWCRCCAASDEGCTDKMSFNIKSLIIKAHKRNGQKCRLPLKLYYYWSYTQFLSFQVSPFVPVIVTADMACSPYTSGGAGGVSKKEFTAFLCKVHHHCAQLCTVHLTAWRGPLISRVMSPTPRGDNIWTLLFPEMIICSVIFQKKWFG